MRAKLAGCRASSTASSCGQFYVPLLCLLLHRRDKQCVQGAKNTFYMNIMYCRKHVSALFQPWFLFYKLAIQENFISSWSVFSKCVKTQINRLKGFSVHSTYWVGGRWLRRDVSWCHPSGAVGAFPRQQLGWCVPNKCVPKTLCLLCRQVALFSSAAETVLALSLLGHVTLHPIFLGCVLWWLQMHLQDGSLHAFQAVRFHDTPHSWAFYYMNKFLIQGKRLTTHFLF